MTDNIEVKNIGLRGVTVADTRISKVEAETGNLLFRGYNINDLATRSTFEEVAFLLIYGYLPSRDEYVSLDEEFRKNRDLPDMLVSNIAERPKNAAPMDVLQSATAALADYDDLPDDDTKGTNLYRAVSLISKLPTIVAYWERIKKGLQIIHPDPELDHAANFLYMLHGEKPDPDTAKDFDLCLILHADHTFNASTFTARQVASTQASIYASISAAVGALGGRLHGGANTKVMNMLLDIKDPAAIDSWVRSQLESGGKIFGMGHAVYKTDDPRMLILKPMSERLAKRTGDTRWYDMTVQIMESTKKHFLDLKGRDIFPNVDFFSASVYYYMGIEPNVYTPIFALSRIAGWTAHVIEEKFAEAQPKPQLYRPRADYTGDYCGPDGCEYPHIDDRETR